MLSRCAGLENSKVATVGGSVIWTDIPCTETCLRTEPGLPALLPLSATYKMKFWLRLKRPVSWFQSEVAFAIPKKDRCKF